MSDNDALVVLRAYNIDGYPAPNRCETCNTSLPDIDSRRKHMAETWHRACRICEGYVPVGGYYGHCEERHGQDKWNDHQIAYQDSQDTCAAQSWSMAERRKEQDEYFEQERKKWLAEVMKMPWDMETEKEGSSAAGPSGKGDKIQSQQGK